MKQNLFTSFAGIFLALVTSICTNGQVSSAYMKSLKEVVSSGNSISKNVSDNIEPGDVNHKAIKDFTKNFKNVSDEKWYNVGGGFVAMFSLDDTKYQVAYDKKGNRLYSIRTYDETKLPHDVRHIVKSTYYDYNITLVQEIEKPLKTITYIIHLEGSTNLINLRFSNGEMDEWQKFDSSPESFSLPCMMRGLKPFRLVQLVTANLPEEMINTVQQLHQSRSFGTS